MRDFLKKRDGKVPVPVLQAISDHEASERGIVRKVGTKTRTVPAVSTMRVKKLIEKYGGGIYVFREIIERID